MRTRSLIVVALLLAGCAAEPVASIAHHQGEPIEAKTQAELGDEACEARIRAEQVGAVRIRGDLRVQGIAADAAAVKAAAEDPDADMSALGIPLTRDEQAALVKGGVAIDRATALAMWVSVGAPDRFGGAWIDPPGTVRYVIAIVGGDPQTVALASCLNHVGARFVWVNQSLADGLAIKDRISADWDAVEASGIDMNSVGYDARTGVVVVGVGHPSAAIERTLNDRYGGPIRLELQEPGGIDCCG